MPAPASIEERIRRAYPDLSGTLQSAADYVTAHPVDVATRSLRALASTSGVSPASFSRLARALGYDDFEQMREDGRHAMGHKMIPFSERAQALRADTEPGDAAMVLHRHATACLSNIAYLDRDIDGEELEAFVDTLHTARSVLLVGSQGSTGFVDHLGYLTQWFSPKWRIAGRNGVATASSLSRLGPEDAVLALSKSPYARRTISALKASKEKKIQTLVITDSHASPALAFADHSLLVPTESPHFFSSYAATLVLLETIVTMLLARAGDDAEDMIRAAEAQVRALGETWSA